MRPECIANGENASIKERHNAHLCHHCSSVGDAVQAGVDATALEGAVDALVRVVDDEGAEPGQLESGLPC